MEESVGALFMFAVVAVIVSVVAQQWWNAPQRVTARKLAQLRASPIHGLQPGSPAKVTGRVVLGQVLDAPISGKRCAYWRVVVQEKTGKNHYSTRSDQWEGVPFAIDDGTGTVRVDPRGLKLALATSQAGSSGTFDDPKPRESEYLRRVDLEPTTRILSMNRNLRYQEASLHDGERVSVAGVVSVAEVDGEPVLTLVAGDGDLLISDAPAAHG